MSDLTRQMLRLTLLSTTIAGLVACGQARQSSQSQLSQQSSPEILTVHVTAAGIITANGREVTFEALQHEFARLATVHGIVRYSRDNPHGDPHPNAMKVIQAVVDANLTLQMLEPKQ